MEKVATARPTRGLAEGLELMKSYRVDSLYLTDKDHHFQGVVFLDALEEHFREESKCLQDIMVTTVKTVRSEDPYTEVAELFADPNVRTIPVVDEGVLVGLVTRSSMMRGLAGMSQKPHVKGDEAVGE